jgi:monoamine oxidase
MTASETEVVVIGAGAAGIAAARRLHEAGVECLLIEARARLGGRAFTVADPSGYAIDLGCGWLHSADRNPWSAIAEAQGRTIDKTPPPWGRLAPPIALSHAEQRELAAAQQALFQRLHAIDDDASDSPADRILEPGGRWNKSLNATSSYINGAELERISLLDFSRYEDTGVNWRVVEGLGTAIASHGAGLPAMLDCRVQRIDHGGRRLRIETAKGTIACGQAIVAVPSAAIGQEDLRFTPALPGKIDAAASLPLGLADKLFLALEDAEEFETSFRLYGRNDRTETANYHFRPFGRPMIEVYFGGGNADTLERGGAAAFFDFAVAELSGVFGSAFNKRVKPIAIHPWRNDPFARGSYSYALPGASDQRAALAAPVDDRLFFAGEACSRGWFSTAHGAYVTGIAAADAVIAARGKQSSR